MWGVPGPCIADIVPLHSLLERGGPTALSALTFLFLSPGRWRDSGGGLQLLCSCMPCHQFPFKNQKGGLLKYQVLGVTNRNLWHKG